MDSYADPGPQIQKQVSMVKVPFFFSEAGFTDGMDSWLAVGDEYGKYWTCAAALSCPVGRGENVVSFRMVDAFSGKLFETGKRGRVSA